MANVEISDLTNKATPTSTDEIEIQETAGGDSQKATLGSLPVSTTTQTALNAKQATLVSGTNIRTINGNTLLGSTNLTTPNTTYAEITEAEITTGTASTPRAISGRRAEFIKTKAVTEANSYTDTEVGSLTKLDLGLENVDNTSDATKNSAAVTLTNKTINGPDNTLTNISGASLDGTYRVLRQNDTTNTTSTTSKILTGWGAFTFSSSVSGFIETVTLPETLSAVPIVSVTFGGDQTSGSVVLGNGGNSVKAGGFIKAYDVTTTNFKVRFVTSDGTNYSSGNIAYYHWQAVV